MLLTACQKFKSTQVVLFESLSFSMSLKSFEEAFGKADEVVEETEMAYRDTWRAEDPYFYKTGRLFYHYKNVRVKDYTGRADFTFSKWHSLEEVTFSIPVTSKTEQKELVNTLSQTIKKEIEKLPDYQSVATDTVGLNDDGYRFKVKLKGQKEEIWIDVYPTEDEDTKISEVNQYRIRMDQFRIYP